MKFCPYTQIKQKGGGGEVAILKGGGGDNKLCGSFNTGT